MSTELERVIVTPEAGCPWVELTTSWRSAAARAPRSFRIGAGVYLSRIMGTSVTQIDETYGHLVPDFEDFLRGLLDAYDVRDDDSGKQAQQR